MPEKFVTRRGLKGDQKGVTPALGVILLMPSLLLAAMAGMMMMNNFADWGNAEADRAAFYASCARAHTDETVSPHPACPGMDQDPNNSPPPSSPPPGWNDPALDDNIDPPVNDPTPAPVDPPIDDPLDEDQDGDQDNDLLDPPINPPALG